MAISVQWNVDKSLDGCKLVLNMLIFISIFQFSSHSKKIHVYHTYKQNDKTIITTMHIYKEAASFELEISYILICLLKWNKSYWNV